MFDLATSSARPVSKTKRGFTLAMSVIAHASMAVLAATLVFRPVGAITDTGPKHLSFVIAEPAAPPRAAAPAVVKPAQPVEPAPVVKPIEPVTATANPTPPEPPPPASTLAGVVNGSADSVAAVLQSTPGTTGLIEPPPIRIGGAIKAPVLLEKVDPEYSALAKQARLQGTVTLEATVDTTGHVKDVKVVQSLGLLDQLALNAVKRWRYAPLTLNGEPMPFILTVKVSFALG